jgi:DNA replication protein DnaC
MIPKMYESATFQNSSLINPKYVEICKKWLYEKDPPPMILYGPAGSGKTYLSVALYKQSCKYCSWVIWVNSFDLDNELLNVLKSHDDFEDRVIAKYSEVPVLIWDDLGVERLTERLQRQYFAILENRLSNGMRTVFTTNCGPKTLMERFGDRLGSRFSFCTWIEFPKKDLRNHETWKQGTTGEALP